MQPNDPVPESFVAYVLRHAGRLVVATQDLTGNQLLAESLLRDLLATVALRWWWLRRRADTAAAAHLDRLVARETRAWPRPPVGGVNRPRRARRAATLAAVRAAADRAAQAAPADAGWARRLAQDVWYQAQRARTRRRLGLVAGVLVVGCALAVGPRAPAADDPQLLPIPDVTAIPAGVLVLPLFTDLAKLQHRQTGLPERIDVGSSSAPRLADDPVGQAVAVARADLGALMVVARDGTVRRVDDAALVRARLLSTSLSPRGDRIALVSSDGLLVIDVDTGRLRALGAGSVRPGTSSLVWRSARTVLVPADTGAQEVDVDTGAIVAMPHVSGLDVVTGRGPGVDELTELLAAASGLPARIRAWRTDAVGDTERDAANRPIAGPPWVGAWIGAGWSTEDLVVRACSATDLVLPSWMGRARGALSAVSADGRHVGTLTTVDFTTLEIVGFVDGQTVLVSAGSAQMATAILAWNPRTHSLQRVADINGFVGVSVADLIEVGD